MGQVAWDGRQRLQLARVHLLARRTGYRHDYDHVSLLTHPDAVHDHFPLVLEWLAGRYGIQSIPTMVLIHHGREVARRSGAMSAAAIESWVRGAIG